MLTNTGITLYNKYISSGKELYQRTQISAVKWENRKAANVIKSGLLEADSVTIFISLAVGAKYLKPVAWQAAKSGKWTLQIGDYVVKGLVSDEIVEAVSGPPAVAAFTMSMLKSKYDDVVQITSVDTMDIGSASMRHWQVGAQ